MSEYVLLVLMACMVTGGEILFKKYIHRIVSGRGIIPFILSLLNPPLLTAVLLSGLAPLLYMKALSGLPLDEAFSFNSLSYLMILVSSLVVLREKANSWQILGILLIAFGFVLPLVISRLEPCLRAVEKGLNLCFPL